MIEISLTHGQFALVDDIDQDLIYSKWAAMATRKSSPGWYAFRNSQQINKIRPPAVFMHRLILERIIKRPLVKGEYTDHINHDGIDNRRSNLRLASTYENHRNQKKSRFSTSSRYKGVSWGSNSRGWRVRIGGGGRNQQETIGYFKSEIDAAKAYDNEAISRFGKFAYLNFPKL